MWSDPYVESSLHLSYDAGCPVQCIFAANAVKVVLFWCSVVIASNGGA